MNKFGWLVAVGFGAFATWGTQDLWRSSPTTNPHSSGPEKRSSARTVQPEVVRKPISQTPTRRAIPVPALEAPPSEPKEEEVGLTPEDRMQAYADSLQISFDEDVYAGADSAGKENAIAAVFNEPQVAEAGGSLVRVTCKRSSCRGEVLLDSQEADRAVFSHVFLSQRLTVPGAISVATREELPDGKIRATFFIHEQTPDMAAL